MLHGGMMARSTGTIILMLCPVPAADLTLAGDTAPTSHPRIPKGVRDESPEYHKRHAHRRFRARHRDRARAQHGPRHRELADRGPLDPYPGGHHLDRPALLFQLRPDS